MYLQSIHLTKLVSRLITELFSAECGSTLKPCRVGSAELNVYPYIIPRGSRDNQNSWLFLLISIEEDCKKIDQKRTENISEFRGNFRAPGPMVRWQTEDNIFYDPCLVKAVLTVKIYVASLPIIIKVHICKFYISRTQTTADKWILPCSVVTPHFAVMTTLKSIPVNTTNTNLEL